MTDLHGLPYTLTPIEPAQVPARVESPVSRYREIVEAFMASGHLAVHLKVPWPEDTTNGQLGTFVSGLRNQVKRFRLPIQVIYRKFEVYLLRTDAPIVSASPETPPAL